ncbi:MAG: hypothetical protein AAF065_01075 [Verrucomicrobiota bacterium]
MKEFPYITDYVNAQFKTEKERFDYIFIRPILLVLYFFIRVIVFPIKFVLHRRSYGFESYCIDGILAFGIKYFASRDAVELLIRHVQIEPLLYRYLLTGQDSEPTSPKKFNGINGDYNVDTLKEIILNNMTIGHDELSYELVDRFDKNAFLENLEAIRKLKPEDHEQYTKKAIALNEKHSLQWFGCTNVVMFIVFVITIFGDLKTTIKALNSFGSDSIALWAMKHIYRNDHDVLTDLDFYMQVYSNRSHYNSSAFFSDPSQYLYYHIVFDEFAYECLRTRTPATAT